MKRPRIVLVDDHRLLSDALRAFIEPEFDVVGVFEDGQSLLDNAAELQPHIVVLDIGMPEMNGLSVGARLKKLLPKVKIIFLTMNREREKVADAFQLGASGYILKTSAGGELRAAIHEVLRGGYYASPVLTEGITGSFVQAYKKMERPRELSARQLEVLQLLVEGKRMKEVAVLLNISQRTVAFHKYTMMRQLGIETNSELVAFAGSVLPQANQ